MVQRRIKESSVKSMLTGVLIFAIVGLLGVLSHRHSRLEEKIFKNIPLSDWLTFLVFPLVMYIGWVLMIKNIIERPRLPLFPLDDFDILAITVLFLVYGFAGNGVHFTGKILWRYLAGNKHSMAYRVNEVFHGKLSHYLTYLNSIFIIFMTPILEINHPLTLPISLTYFIFLIFAGIISGISATKAVFYTNEWFGGYNKPLFFIANVLTIILFTLYKKYQLSYSFYPVTLFITSMFTSFVTTFVIRQLFIFAKLKQKRRLKFLARILSV